MRIVDHYAHGYVALIASVPPQLLGFPIQLLGLVMLPYLVVRYYVDGADLAKDAGEAVVCWSDWQRVHTLCAPTQTSVTSKLPGLEKK